MKKRTESIGILIGIISIIVAILAWQFPVLEPRNPSPTALSTQPAETARASEMLDANGSPAASTSTTPSTTDTPHTTTPPTPTFRATSKPTPTPRPTATARCSVSGHFASIWDRHSEQLGCPLTDVLISPITAEEFERGYLVWFKLNDKIYSLPVDGAWQQHNNPWTPSEDIFSCQKARQYGYPTMGFGEIWCEQPSIAVALGEPLAEEKPNESARQQRFEGGMIFEIAGGRTIVTLDTGAWWEY